MVASRILAATLAASGLSHAASDTKSQAVSSDFGPSVEVAKSRAPQIFNAVHDTMRQWGESLHHNGMSFFLATVPEGVILHHGNNDERSPDEPDWLAYEIEHAEGFARGRFGGPGGGPGGGGPPGGGPPGSRPTDGLRGDHEEGAQSPLELRAPVEEEPKGGWLHTYRAVRPLRYLYVDGMSGGKTQMGTLDSQDYLLRGTKEVLAFDNKEKEKEKDRVHEKRGGGPMDERARAIELCALCKDWNLSGVIRMEAGFEIIQCDFSDGYEQLQALQRPANSGGGGRGGGMGSFEFLRGLAERYHDIGSSRTFVDYSSMVSAFFFPVNLTNPDLKRPDLPRLSNTTDAELAAIQGYLNRTITARFSDPVRSIDWRDVTDLIVGRYADRIKYLAEKSRSVAQVRDEINFLLTVYIDFSGKDGAAGSKQQIAAATERCADFYLHGVAPATEADRLIHAAVRTVTSEICTRLFDVRALVAGGDDGNGDDDDDAATLKEAVAALRSLIAYLEWARFKRCPACDVDEVCFIPMWPMGSKEDYDSPRCVNSSNNHEGDNYWGGFGRPGHGPGGGRGGKGGPPRP